MEALLIVGGLLLIVGTLYGLYRLYKFANESAKEHFGYNAFNWKYLSGYFISIASVAAGFIVLYYSKNAGTGITLNVIVPWIAGAIISLILTIRLILKTNWLIGLIAAVLQFAAATIIVVIIAAYITLFRKSKNRI